jgi:hypothetical protein
MKLKVEHFHAYDLVSIFLINQAKYYAQDTGNQYKTKAEIVVFGMNIYLNKINIKF